MTVAPNGNTSGGRDRFAADVVDVTMGWVDERGSHCVLELDGRRYPLHPAGTAA